MSKIKAVIYGVSGTELTAEEEEFFIKEQPLGFILFARNCKKPKQIKMLVEKLKKLIKHEFLQILIDQEGGRVARLTPPDFHRYNPAAYFAEVAQTNLELAKEAVSKNFQAMSGELQNVGINVNCAPVVDLYYENAHGVIGDRSYGSLLNHVVELSEAAAVSMMRGGVTPVIKHIPGHGRANLDSHEALPIIDAGKEELMATDFAAFKNLVARLNENGQPYFAMTGHMQFSDIDDLPTTFSKKTIEIIRDEIGFKGLLMTDDLSMKALKGSFGQRVRSSLDAGCDLLLHCNGDLKEMLEIAKEVPEMTESQKKFLVKYDASKTIENENISKMLAEVNEVLTKNLA